MNCYSNKILIFSLVISLSSAFAMSDRIHLPTNVTLADGQLIDNKTQEPIDLSPEHAMFAFDWDQTLVDASWLQIAKQLVSNPGMVRKLAAIMLLDFSSYLFKKKWTAEALFEDLHEKNSDVAHFILSLGDSSEPIPGMEQIVQQLKQQGYDAAIATNKEWVLFKRVMRNPAVASFMALLPKGVVVWQAPTGNNAIKASTVSKPDIGYYNTFDQEFNPVKKIVIFVDDKLKNFEQIDNGQLQNWIGIQFSNPAAFLQDLQALGIMHDAIQYIGAERATAE